MPFGLTGTPNCFNEVTGRALHGLVDTMIQLFVDDGAMAGDIFADKFVNLQTFFLRCHEESLSLSTEDPTFHVGSHLRWQTCWQGWDQG